MEAEAFVKAVVHTKSGETKQAEFMGWNVDIYGVDDFSPSQKFLDNLESGNELIDAMKEWFIDSLDETEYVLSCVDETSLPTSDIRALKREEMQKLELSSLLDNGYDRYGSEISYDFDTKKRKREKTK